MSVLMMNYSNFFLSTMQNIFFKSSFKINNWHYLDADKPIWLVIIYKNVPTKIMGVKNLNWGAFVNNYQPNSLAYIIVQSTIFYAIDRFLFQPFSTPDLNFLLFSVLALNGNLLKRYNKRFITLLRFAQPNIPA